MPVTAPSVPVGAVVAQPGADRAERLLARAEQRRARVVLVADDVAVGGVEDDRADHPLGVALRGDVEDAEAGQAPALDGDEGVAEQLVHAADHQHRRAVGGQVPQHVGVAGQVVLDPGLPAVLAAAAHEQVRVLGQVLAGVVRRDDRLVAVPAQPGRQAPGVAQVAVDAHLARVEVDEVDPALAHWDVLPEVREPVARGEVAAQGHHRGVGAEDPLGLIGVLGDEPVERAGEVGLDRVDRDVVVAQPQGHVVGPHAAGHGDPALAQALEATRRTARRRRARRRSCR